MTTIFMFLAALAAASLLIWFFSRSPGPNKKLMRFYPNNSLFITDAKPPLVNEAIGEKMNATCRQGNLKLASGGETLFYWWEWYTTSRVKDVGGSSRASYKNFLVASFPPNVVSDEFKRKAQQAMHNSDTSQALSNVIWIDTQTPVRAETLVDGSFLIGWQVSEQVKVLEEKLEWLKNNVMLRN